MEHSIRSTDFLSKWGGDEFVLLMPNTELSSAISLIERLRLKIAELSFEGIRITCSFGIAELAEEDDETIILDKADKNLYLAKAEGKNKIRF
ncbi:Diguanylate cyclase DgcM [bioreactor metagenome]|uniref:Diguanylate cyclase DgcM n=1 Tax=bioreactor metagenome TaxID=1076179 RepID=A0A645IZX5_9ZZZZ